MYIKSKILISKSLIQNHYSILVQSLIYNLIKYPMTHMLHLFILLKIHVIVKGNIYIIFWKVLCRRMYQHYCRCNIFHSSEKMIELSSRLKFMNWKFKTSLKVYNDVFWMNKVTKKGWETSDKTLAPLGFDPRTFGLWAQHATSAPRSNLIWQIHGHLRNHAYKCSTCYHLRPHIMP